MAAEQALEASASTYLRAMPSTAERATFDDDEVDNAEVGGSSNTGIGGLGTRGARASQKTESKKAKRSSGQSPVDAPSELEILRGRARSQGSLLLGQAPIDEQTRVFLVEVNDYLKTPIGPSPLNNLLERANAQDSHPAIKPQLWYLIGEIYLLLGQQENALEAFKKALGQ